MHTEAVITILFFTKLFF